MGIPFYFKSLISRFPDIVNLPNGTCDALYLDFNCIIHMCAQKLAASENSPHDFGTFHNHVITNSLNYIDHILKHVLPAALLYIAVDGACPRSKMQQQRKRRFMSMWRTRKQTELGLKRNECSVWDSNIVTPGTEFMKEFDQRLRDHVVAMQKHHAFKIQVSGSDEFGEGEHKIFDHMNQCEDHKSVVVYGLDADLILLSILQEKFLISLMREVPEFNVVNFERHSPFLMLSIPFLKSAITREYMFGNAGRTNDYVMLCTLIGNDFIPPLSFLKIKSDGIDILLRLYHKHVSNNKDDFLVSTESKCPTLNWKLLTDIVKDLADIEDTSMLEVSNTYYSGKVFIDQRFPEGRIDNYPMLFKFPKVIDISQHNWRTRYNKMLFQYNNTNVVNTACELYIEGINWVFQYYFTKNHNLGWYYPFHYSPTCLDLYNYLIASDSNHISLVLEKSKNKHNTHKEFINYIQHHGFQLLMVLPPSSKLLLPTELQQIMENVEYGCVQYYPQNFDITTYLKSYLWECSAIIPDINIDLLHQAYKKVNQKI